MKIHGYIYKITNTLTNAIYIGKVVAKKGIQTRFTEHLTKPFNPSTKMKKTHLSLAISKYGKENFKIEEIDKAFSKEELNEKEIYWIEKLDAYKNPKNYNMTSGGDGGCEGYKHTEEAKKKISENNKNRIITDSMRKNSSEAQKRRVEAGLFKGGRKKIKVCMLELETENVLKIFNSIAEGAVFLGKKEIESGIRRVLKGEQKTCMGYKWKKFE